MPLQTTSAFVAGVATGWVLRSVLGSSREAMVRVLVIAHRGREKLKRVVAENAEWLDDLFAEGRARHHDARPSTPIHDETPPHVVAKKADRAA